MITKEHIERRAADLQKRAEKLQSELNATLGALQDCGYWLEQLRLSDEPSNAPPEVRHEDRNP